MRECWIKPNRRALAALLLAPGLLAAIGIPLAAYGWLHNYLLITITGCALATLAALAAALLAYSMSIPRLAYEDGRLLVFLGSTRPYRVPIEIVEVFFLGQGPAMPDDHDEAGPTTRNVVVRLAEAASDWQHREIRRELGQWCGGYIVIRGTWCEPISLERLNELNHRLAEIRRQRRSGAGESASTSPATTSSVKEQP